MKKLIFILCLFFVTTAFDCGGGKSTRAPLPPVTGQPVTGGDKNVTRKTSLGLTLASSKAIPADVDAIADAVYTKLLKDARSLGYTLNLDARVYTIIVKQDCEPSSDGTSSFRVRADDYDGTEFDKNPQPGIGEVLAAEQVLMSRGNVPTNTFIICYGSPELMSNTVRYGLEHILIFYNDYGNYPQSIATSHVHPLIAPGPE